MATADRQSSGRRFEALDTERVRRLRRDGRGDPAELLRRGIELSRFAQRLAAAGARAGLRT